MIIAPEKFGGQNSAYRHLNMKGAFGNEGALRFSMLGGHPNTRADIPQLLLFRRPCWRGKVYRGVFRGRSADEMISLRKMNLKFLFSMLTVFVFATAPLCRAAADDTVLLNTLG